MTTRYVVRYVAIVLLIALGSTSAIIYSRYGVGSEAQSVVPTPAPPPTYRYNTYPISPYPIQDDIYSFAQRIGGSGDDYIRDAIPYDDDIYLIGDTTSHDKDIRANSSHSVFVASVDKISLSLTNCITISNATYQDSTIIDNDVIVAYTVDNHLVVATISSTLLVTKSVSIPTRSAHAYIECTEAYINVIYLDTYLLVSHIDRSTYHYTTTTLPYCDSVVDVCTTNGSIVINTTLQGVITLYIIDDTLDTKTYVVGSCDKNISLSAMDEDCLLLYSQDDYLYLDRYDSDLNKIFSTRAISGQDGYIISTPRSILVISYAVGTAVLCSHGDILLSTCDVLVSNVISSERNSNNLTLLCKIGTRHCIMLASPLGRVISTTYTPPITPIALVSGILVFNTDSTTPSLGLGYGETDGYLLQ